MLDDEDGDDFYDVGEGLGGIAVSVSGTGFSASTTTYGGGGYSVAVPGTPVVVSSTTP